MSCVLERQKTECEITSIVCMCKEDTASDVQRVNEFIVKVTLL